MAYTIAPARYAKGKMAVRCPSPDKFKTRAARLAEAMGRSVYYSHRSHAYIMSAAMAGRFAKLYAEGWDGNVTTNSLEPPAQEAAPC